MAYYLKNGKEYKGPTHRMNGQIHTGASHSSNSQIVTTTKPKTLPATTKPRGRGY
jgi:hypothetical protein